MWLMKPVMADPPLCRIQDLDVLTIDQVADLHEMLDLREAVARKMADRDR